MQMQTDHMDSYEVCTSEEQAAFTNGDCWAFAVALHDLTGFPLYVVGDEEKGSWWHAFVYDEAGELCWDATGAWYKYDFLDEWAVHEDWDEEADLYAVPRACSTSKRCSTLLSMRLLLRRRWLP